MALSNIFREPRREITESIVGIAAFGVAMAGDYHFARWFEEITTNSEGHGGCPWPLGLMFGFIFLGIIIAVVFFTHAIGDSICNALQERGIHLRPRNRP